MIRVSVELGALAVERQGSQVRLHLTLDEAKDIRRRLGQEIEKHESEAEQRRRDGVREYLGDFER